MIKLPFLEMVLLITVKILPLFLLYKFSIRLTYQMLSVLALSPTPQCVKTQVQAPNAPLFYLFWPTVQKAMSLSWSHPIESHLVIRSLNRFSRSGKPFSIQKSLLTIPLDIPPKLKCLTLKFFPFLGSWPVLSLKALFRNSLNCVGVEIFENRNLPFISFQR